MTSPYDALTASPQNLVGVPSSDRPLPELALIEQPPLLAVDPTPEPMHSIEHGAITLLQAYAQAGWPSATPHMVLRGLVVQRLSSVAENLPRGFGLAVFDAWRPLELQAELYAAYNAQRELPPGYLAKPSHDPLTPPPHTTGGAVDLTLTSRGTALSLGTSFDDFTPEAHLGAYEQTDGTVRDLRRMLYWSMADAGFVGLGTEWWHFEYGTRRWAAQTGSVPLYGRWPTTDRRLE